MACTATNCATCTSTNGCGWNGTTCGTAGANFNAACSSAYAGSLLTPSPQLLDAPGMATLGTAGYVDPYLGLRAVPASAVKYGEYNKKVYLTQLSGSNMQSCVPNLRYGDGVLLKSGITAATASSGVVTFGLGGTTFLLRPPPGGDRTGDVRFGDSVVLTTTITATNTCGVYGCSVGNVVNGVFQVGSGGTVGGAQLKLSSPTSATGPIPYGAPLLISARVALPSKQLSVNQSLYPTRSLPSPSGRYMLVYGTDGDVGVYCTDQRKIWASGVLHAPKRLTMSNGALVAYNSAGLPAWSQQVYGSGPYSLLVTDSGSAQILGGTTVLWSSPADTQPGLVATNPVLQGALRDSQLQFGTGTGSTFTLDAYPRKHCDFNAAAVSALCGDDCGGLIYSQSDSTWQPLTRNAGDYVKASTTQMVVLKKVLVNLKDDSCPTGEAKIVDDYGTPTGTMNFGGKDQCMPLQASTVLPTAFARADATAVAAEAELTNTIAKTAPLLSEIANAREKPEDPTAIQQAKDWVVVNREYKSRSYVWFLAAGALLIVAAVLARRRMAK